MRATGGLIAILAFAPFFAMAQETKTKQDYAEFSRLVHGMVVKQLPKEIEDASGWGQTIPLEPNLPLAKLRTYVKVGDKIEMPHGSWRRFKGKVEEPNKNLKIVIKDFKQLNGKTWRVVADVDVIVMVDAEFQQWQKGLMLFGVKGVADANVAATLVCDVDASLDLKEFPPALKLEPKVTELGLQLVDFRFRGGPLIKNENLRNDVLELMRGAVKSAEPAVKDYANQAIAQSLKEGKGAISAAAIMKAMPK